METEDNGEGEALDPNAEVVSDEDTTEASSPDDQGAPEGDEGDPVAEQPKKQTAKDRIDELTRARREAERDAEYWKAKAIQSPEPAKAAPAPVEKARPDPASYDAGEFDPRFVEDLTDWKVEAAVAKAQEGFRSQSQAQSAETEWNKRAAKAAETLPDFEDKVIRGAERGSWACSPLAAQALRNLDAGPQIAYALASNPDEAARIYRLPDALQMIEIGKLEAKLVAPKTAKTATSAPSPAPSVRGSGGQFSVRADTDDFAAFDKQFGNGSS